MAERDLKLNTLGRFGKSNSRLLLEEYGSCEVPAGCGGVVLRWRNPNSGILFLLHLFGTGKGTILVDGVVPSSGRPLISFGEHVLSLQATDLVPDSVVLAVAAIQDETQFGFPQVSQLSGRKLSILTADDGTWRYVTTQPTDDTWMRPGFDDSGWRAMKPCKPPTLDKQDMQKYRLETVLKNGATCLGIQEPSPEAWIRKAFTLNRTDNPKSKG